MDKLASYRQIIRTVLLPYTQITYANVPVRNIAVFDDEHGILLHSLCWMASISITDNVKIFGSLLELSQYVDEYILMLPQLVNNFFVL